MQSRRQFLGSIAVPAAGALGTAALAPSCTPRVARAFEGREAEDSRRVASDESVWFEVQRAFGRASNAMSMIEQSYRRLARIQ